MAPVRHDVFRDGRGSHERVNCDVVLFGDLLFLSGCGPTDTDGTVRGDDVVAQTRLTLSNMAAGLATVGATLADVLRITVYLIDIGDFPLIREVRMAAFGTVRPASTLVEVSALARTGMRIEIDAIAGLGAGAATALETARGTDWS